MQRSLRSVLLVEHHSTIDDESKAGPIYVIQGDVVASPEVHAAVEARSDKAVDVTPAREPESKTVLETWWASWTRDRSHQQYTLVLSTKSGSIHIRITDNSVKESLSWPKGSGQGEGTWVQLCT